ncbi:MAG: hypothetical protein AMXMBFR57_09930 [Acidimicrobiia bacterium]|jgi:hypothetical protein
MVLTKSELIGSLKNEVRILMHLAGKVDRAQLDYRPTPKQRSTMELLQYLSIMGPELVKAAIAGTFDGAVWGAAEAESKARDFDQTLAVIEGQGKVLADLLGALPDEAFREEINLFGMPASRGSFIVNVALSGYAAYRTQLFCYLKACGREELSTMNLWMGADGK